MSVCTGWPVVRSQTLTVLSWPTEASRCPSGLNTAFQTMPVCPLSWCSTRPVAASQTLTILSWPAPAIRFPSGLNAAPCTLSVRPARVRISLPVPTSQNFTAPSQSPDASRVPSELNTGFQTELVWPLSVWITRPVDTSQIRTVVSVLVEARRLPIGAERHVCDSLAVAGQAVDELASRRVPDFDGAVVSARGDVFPVGAERQTPRSAGHACESENFRVTQPLEVIPLPVALVGRAVIEQRLHAADVAVPPLRVRHRDVMEVFVPFRLPGRGFRLRLGLLGLL